MGIAVSLIIIAVGAILTFAVTSHAQGVNVDAVGLILMVVGLVGFVLSLFYWSSWGGPGFVRRRAYVDDGPAPPRRRYAGRRTRYVEEEEDVGAPPPP